MNQLEKLNNRIKELELSDEHFAVKFVNSLFKSLYEAGGDYEIFVIIPPSEPDPTDILTRDYGIKFRVTVYVNEEQLTDFWYGKGGSYTTYEHVEEFHKNRDADINIITEYHSKKCVDNVISQITKLYRKMKVSKSDKI